MSQTDIINLCTIAGGILIFFLYRFIAIRIRKAGCNIFGHVFEEEKCIYCERTKFDILNNGE
jgi:thioredoxin-related protein